MPELAGFSSNAEAPTAIPRQLDSIASPRTPGESFPLLLAIANDETANAAIRLTRALAVTRGAVPSVLHALGVVRAAEASVSPLGGTVVEEYLGPEYLSECRAVLEKKLSSVTGDAGWPLEVTDELPIEAIVERSKAQRGG